LLKIKPLHVGSLVAFDTAWCRFIEQKGQP
jgi:hypothetical protein